MIYKYKDCKSTIQLLRSVLAQIPLASLLPVPVTLLAAGGHLRPAPLPLLPPRELLPTHRAQLRLLHRAVAILSDCQ